jgi:dihydrodipicolinate synthase/N-acetylneuraminate lyase
VIAVSPFYSCPPQAGIESHFRAIAQAASLPVMLYDVPLRTGRRVARNVLVRLFREVSNIVALKDATGDPRLRLRIREQRRMCVSHGDCGLAPCPGRRSRRVPATTAGRS